MMIDDSGRPLKRCMTNKITLEFFEKAKLELFNPHTNIEKIFLNMWGPCGPQEGYWCDIEAMSGVSFFITTMSIFLRIQLLLGVINVSKKSLSTI